MNLLRKILLPIVPVYYLVTWLRNVLYDTGIKKSTSYDFPVIAVGNLSVGGTGKSPMIEYLIRLLKGQIRLATLSRGYKRKHKGFQLAEIQSTVVEVGDEPLQFKKKYTDILVGVDGNRQRGIKHLRSLSPIPEVILLDDAYQHRKVTAGLYILLTSYDDLYCNDILLPTGNLREPRRGADRADIVVVTKCPSDIGSTDQERISKKLNAKPHQQLFFTTIVYGNSVINTSAKKSLETLRDSTFTLVTGIANPKPLVNYYTSLGLEFDHLKFPDHHNFTVAELENLKAKETIVTTEKDYMRLQSHMSKSQLWYQPMEIKFVKNGQEFDKRIFDFIEK